MAGREKRVWKQSCVQCQLPVGAGVAGVARLCLARQPGESPFVGLASLYRAHTPSRQRPPRAGLPGPLCSRAAAASPTPKPRCPLLDITARRRPWGRGGSSGRGAEQSPPATTPADRFRVSAGSVGDGARAVRVRGCVAAGAGGRGERDRPPGAEPKFVLAFGKGRYFPLPPSVVLLKNKPINLGAVEVSCFFPFPSPHPHPRPWVCIRHVNGRYGGRKAE